jgi:hypothetical protein
MAKRKTGTGALIEQTKAAALARNTVRLAELVALIRRRMTGVVEGFYDIGEALREIVDKKLYAAAGHASMAAFLKTERLLSDRQASKLMAVVRKVPREQALSLGQEKAYALVSYTEATPELDSAGGLLASDAKVGGVAVTKASVRQIEAATRAVRASAKAKRPPTEAERAQAKNDAALVKALRAALRDAGIERAQIELTQEHVRMELTRAQAERLARERSSRAGK